MLLAPAGKTPRLMSPMLLLMVRRICGDPAWGDSYDLGVAPAGHVSFDYRPSERPRLQNRAQERPPRSRGAGLRSPPSGALQQAGALPRLPARAHQEVRAQTSVGGASRVNTSLGEAEGRPSLTVYRGRDFVARISRPAHRFH